MQAPNQPPSRFSEPDNRDWRGRSALPPSAGEERSWENIRDRDFGARQQDLNQFSRQENLNSQFARAQISSNQGVIESLVLSYISLSFELSVSFLLS